MKVMIAFENPDIAAALMMLAGLFSTAPETAAPLKQSEIRPTLVGPVLNWRLLGFPKERIGERQYAADGTFWWKRLDADYAGTGTWRVLGDEFCEKYDPAQSWKGRDWECFPVRRQGEYMFFGNTFVWKAVPAED